MKSQDIAIVGILIAVGAIARFAANIIPGPLVPNFVIVFYSLAIMLVMPRYTEAIGIGFIGGIISALISHSLFPPANLISEPIGAIVCLFVFKALKDRISFGPLVATLAATIASGISFLIIVMILVMVAPNMLYKAFNYESLYAFFTTLLVMIVLPTAVLNTIVAQILYFPAARVLSRRS
jgi:hypothetical protein